MRQSAISRYHWFSGRTAAEFNVRLNTQTMSDRRVPTDLIAAAIRQIFVEDWDPIGVMDDPDWPRDEYDSYIGEVHGFLERGESEEFIARRLCFIEDKKMGLGSPTASARQSVARKLKAITLCRADNE
jgi:hypothetical protein